MSEPGRLSGKVALVTGGAAGLGLAIAMRLAADGATVAISDRQVDSGAAAAAGGGFAFFLHDVCDESGWNDVIEAIEARFGGLDILVNNAGIVGPLEDTDPEHARIEDWRRVFAVNVEGVMLGCRAAIGAMRRRGGGAIINMSSVAGLQAQAFALAYGTSKAAVRHLTKGVAQYCLQQKLAIRCNSVHPGDVHTPLWDRAAEEFARARGVPRERIFAECVAGTPSGTAILPEDVAAAVAFLASDDARQITGMPLTVDGGLIHCDSFHHGASVAHRLECG